MRSSVSDYQKKIGVFVEKATDKCVEPPKEKHVRSLIIASCEKGQNADCVIAFYTFFYKRLSTCDPIICLKSLVAYHRILQEGCSLFLSRKIINDNFFSHYLGQWNGSNWGKPYGKLCCAYAEALNDKLRFHLANPNFTGDLSAESFDRVTPFKNLETGRAMTMLSSLFGLLKALTTVSDMIIDIGKHHLADTLICAPCIPIIVESYNIYTCLTRLLRVLSDVDDQDPQFKAAVGAFNRVFGVLQKFYFECAQIQYVATTVTVPQLPDEPPSFEKYRPPTFEPPKPTPAPEPAPLQVEVNKQPQSWMDMLTAQNAPSPVVIQQQTSATNNPFADLIPSISSMALKLPDPEPEPEPVPQVDPRDEEIERLKKRIAELELLVIQLRAENNKLKEQLNQAQTRADLAEQALKKEEGHSAQLQAALSSKSPMENAMKELEAMLNNEKQTNTELQRQVAELQTTQQQKIEEMQARYESQLAEQARAQEALARQLSEMCRAWQQDRWMRTHEISTEAENELDNALSQLNNPTFVGNIDATTDSVRSDLEALRKVTESYLNLISQPPKEDALEDAKHVGDIQRGIRDLSKAVSILLVDSKGVACNLPKKHTNLQSSLIGGASRVGIAARAAVSSGSKPQHTEEDMQKLRVGSDTSANQLSELLDAINKALAEDERASSEVNVSIDDDAQRQLLAAASQIEALAAQLRESRKNIQHDPSLAPGAISVDEAIMEAAIAISQATHMLVNAAAAAQKERVEKGRAQATAARPYVANAVWAEGLVSAGRAVAMATRDLTNVANDAAKTKGMGEMVEEGLIAASHGVAASTAQLVAATRSKSDMASPTQTQVEEAAKAVTRATELLVEAAKAVGIAKQQQQPREDYSKLGANAFRIKEMEQQMLIQRLEKELNTARNKLGEMHRQAYKK